LCLEKILKVMRSLRHAEVPYSFAILFFCYFDVPPLPRAFLYSSSHAAFFAADFFLIVVPEESAANSFTRAPAGVREGVTIVTILPVRTESTT
jgi:hypothetical protein